MTDVRRKFFAAGMSNLTPEQLQTFWAVYADYEKEKDARWLGPTSPKSTSMRLAERNIVCNPSRVRRLA
jgi:hypothetical protein